MMNFFDCNGSQYPFRNIQTAANARLISIRSGCFCNPGIDEINSKISAQELEVYFENRVAADYDDMVSLLGKLRGAIRVSVGIPTNRADIQAFISLARTFIDKAIPSGHKKTEGLNLLVGLPA
jgi:selenocysteine lyase/cysteine desulfurase